MTTSRLVSCAALLGLAIPALASSALAQSAPAFEVTSVRPSPDTPPGPGMAGVQISKQQARFAFLSLRDYVGIAFKVPIQQVSGPDWMNSARFDIAATLPPGATDEDFPRMMEELLRSRFKLQAHRESREAPVYVLQAGRNGSTLVAIPDDTPRDAPFTITSSGGPDGVAVDLGHGASLTMNNTRIEFRKVTMQTLADTLGRFMDRPVVDRTTLEGRFDVAFPIAPEDYMPLIIRSAVNAGIQLPAQALQLLDAPSRGSVEAGLASLGLSLERQRAPLDFIVVDSLERTPTEN